MLGLIETSWEYKLCCCERFKGTQCIRWAGGGASGPEVPYKVNRPLVEEYVQPEADERKNGHIIDVFKQKRRVGWSIMSGLTSECVYLEKFSQVPMVTNSTKYSTLLDQANFLINYSLQVLPSTWKNDHLPWQRHIYNGGHIVLVGRKFK